MIRGLLTAAVLISAGSPGRAPAHAQQHPRATAVLAGGCYWGVESVYRHVRGIVSVTSGYAAPADGPRVEAVRIVYDPSVVTYRRILDVFFLVVHDPTQLDRQGPDVGPAYRSVVFAGDGDQRRTVQAYVHSLGAARVFTRPIVTQVAALRSFEAVDASQQNYAARHPADPYIVQNDAPKIEALRLRFPDLYVAESGRVRTGATVRH
ncbi:MAG TPA: peptide-methionine (S)-S-oxide reductase [Gemmatimonadales bacterium]|nr:peptide-methionine (S)-S-oxide reductase [Gemmatimonadales bacterium]